MRSGKKALDHWPHGLRPKHQRLFAAAPIEHPVGEDVTSIEIGAELHLVDCEKRHVEVARHGFDSADPKAGVRRLDLLLAGDESDGFRSDAFHNLVVDLTRQESQRQADNSGRMAEHALDRQMRLAGVGGAKHGSHAGAAGDGVTARRERE
jgi:hypothetical protein